MVTTVRKSQVYHDLVRAFPLRPIRSLSALDEASAVVDRLAVKHPLTKDERDYLDVLSSLIERYENERFPIAPLPDQDMLAFLIEQKGVAQQVVARQAGIASSTISEILRGKRQLTRRQIEKLAVFFNVEPGVFLQGS